MYLISQKRHLYDFFSRCRESLLSEALFKLSEFPNNPSLVPLNEQFWELWS